MGAHQAFLRSNIGTAGLPGVVSLTDQVIVNVGNTSVLQAAYELNDDGKVYKLLYPGAGVVYLEDWVDPLATAWQFEVQVVKLTGGVVNGTLGAWLPLTSTYQWYVQANAAIGQTVTAEIAVTIRRIGYTTPEATAYIDLTAGPFS